MEETPGAPPPNNEKPNQNPKKISFCLNDLNLFKVVLVEGHSYLLFLCRNEYMFSIRKWEYFELLDKVYNILEDEDELIEVTINALYEDMGSDIQIKGVNIDLETQTQTEFDKTIPLYELFNLCSNISVDIIDEENE